MKYKFCFLFLTLTLIQLHMSLSSSYGQDILAFDTAKVKYIFAQFIAIDNAVYSIKDPANYSKAFVEGDFEFNAHFFEAYGYTGNYIFYGIDYSDDLFVRKKSNNTVKNVNISFVESRKGRPMLIAVNRISYECHRISGFFNTDILNFYMDIRNYYLKSSGKRITKVKFFNNLKIEGVELKSIYKELKKELNGGKGVLGNQYYTYPY